MFIPRLHRKSAAIIARESGLCKGPVPIVPGTAAFAFGTGERICGGIVKKRLRPESYSFGRGRFSAKPVRAAEGGLFRSPPTAAGRGRTGLPAAPAWDRIVPFISVIGRYVRWSKKKPRPLRRGSQLPLAAVPGLITKDQIVHVIQRGNHRLF